MAKVNLENVRLSFPAIFKPESYENNAPRFSAKFIIEPGSANAKKLDETMLATAKEKWGDKGQQIFDGLIKLGKLKTIEVPYMKQPYINRAGEAHAGFEGKHCLIANNKARPTVVDRDTTQLIEADGRPYAGCYVNAIVEIWAQDNVHGQALRAEIKGVQFFRDGDAFSGGSSVSADEFTDFSSGDDADSIL